MITKELFIEVIESIRLQLHKDEENRYVVNHAFHSDTIGDAIINNSLLIKVLMKLLQEHFPKDENGYCEIEHFCLKINFGKEGSESDLITINDLYEKLSIDETQHLLSTKNNRKRLSESMDQDKKLK